MNLILNVPPERFDPLGRSHTVYHNAVRDLPEQIREKLRGATYGYLNAPDTPEPASNTSNTSSAMEDEIKRRILAGDMVIVGPDGQAVQPPAYQAPETVVGEGGSYGFLFEFAGGQTAFVEYGADMDNMDAVNFRLSDGQIVLLCMSVR